MDENILKNIPIIKQDTFNNNEEMVSYVNNISLIIKKFSISISQIINNLKNISKKLVKQIINSSLLIKEINKDKRYSIKCKQLNNKIELQEESRKLLDEYIKLITYSINYFSKDIKSAFMKIQEYNRNKNQFYYNKNNNDVKTEVLDKKFEKYLTISSLNNYKNKKDLNNHNANDNNFYYTINCPTPINKSIYLQMKDKNRNSNNKIRNIILNSALSEEPPKNIKYNYHLSTHKKVNKNFDLGLTHPIRRKINSTNNSYRLNMKSDSIKTNLIDSNKFLKEKSRNSSKNSIIKRTQSLTNLLLDKNKNTNKNFNNNININSFRKHYTSNKIINNNNENNTKTINVNSRHNYNGTINVEEYTTSNGRNNNLSDNSLLLSHKVIQFLSIIQEMKDKYNNRNCENNLDFKEIKLKYENLKKSISDLSYKVINDFYINSSTIQSLNSNNTMSANNTSYKNNLNKNNDTNELLSMIKMYREKIKKLENNCKTLLSVKEKVFNDNVQKSKLISKIMKELEELKSENNIRNNQKYNINLNSVKIEENYILQIKKLKLALESKNNDITKKDRIIANLNTEIKNLMKNNNYSNYKNKNFLTNNNNQILLIENATHFSIINDISDINDINRKIIEEKEEIITLLKNEINSLNNKISKSKNKVVINKQIPENINHINNNIYIINQYKEKVKKLKEENSNLKSKYNQISKENKSLSKEIESLSNINKTNELLKEEQEQKIKELNVIINENLNNEDNNNKIIDIKENKEKIELLINENQELKNEIEELKENQINTSSKDKENDFKELINDYEAKIKLYTEKNDYYKQNIDNLKIENSIINQEFENVKNENNKLHKLMKEHNIKIDDDEYIPNNYDIIADKSIGNLSWFLLRQKLGDKNNYSDYIWVEKNNIDNLEEFNYVNEIDLVNKKIINYISQLEEKELIIGRLTQKLNKYENNNDNK